MTSAPNALADLGRRASAAARVVARSSSSARDDALRHAADLIGHEGDRILTVNGAEVNAAEGSGMAAGGLDRLRLTPARVEAMAAGLRQVADLADPVGEVVDGWVRPNGLRIERVRVPLGVVGVIYENRPNVTSDAAGLCLKAGNATLLRGSSTAVRTNTAVCGLLRRGLAKAGLPEDAVGLVEDTSRASAVAFMQLRDYIDCLVPRGGPSLIATIREHATVPFVEDGDGNCHVYVDAAADLSMAEDIVVNAKMQRPGVCNAAETLLVHRKVAPAFLPRVAAALAGVDLVGDEAARAVVGAIGPASTEDFAVEFLGPRMAVAVVDSLDDAIDHIATYSSGHSEAIVTGDLAAADRFTAEVDAAAVLVNASTRFVDGEQFGLGAEIGISTQKLHARGPMGVRELTCVKYVIHGNGQVRP